MTSFKLICFVIFMLNVLRIQGAISDKRLCGDITCSEPISTAKTLLKYSSPEEGVLSFPAQADIEIFSKEAGTNTGLWGAKYKDKRGYVPKSHVRETKLLKKKGEVIHLVDTEFKNVPLPPVVSPNKVQEAYEVVDGTTIYVPSDEPSKQSPILQATGVPTPVENLVTNVKVGDNVEIIAESLKIEKPAEIDVTIEKNLRKIDNIVIEEPVIKEELNVKHEIDEKVEKNVPKGDNLVIDEPKIEESKQEIDKESAKGTEGSLLGNIMSYLGNSEEELKDESEIYIDDDEDDIDIESDEDENVDDDDDNDDFNKDTNAENIKSKELEEIRNLKRKEAILKIKEEYEKTQSPNYQEKKEEGIQVTNNDLKLDADQINNINDLSNNKIDNVNIVEQPNKLGMEDIPPRQIIKDTTPELVDTSTPIVEITPPTPTIETTPPILHIYDGVTPTPLNIYEGYTPDSFNIDETVTPTPDPLNMDNEARKPNLGIQNPDISKGFNYFNNRKDFNIDKQVVEEIKDQTIENIPTNADLGKVANMQQTNQYKAEENKQTENMKANDDILEKDTKIGNLTNNYTDESKPTIETVISSENILEKEASIELVDKAENLNLGNKVDAEKHTDEKIQTNTETIENLPEKIDLVQENENINFALNDSYDTRLNENIPLIEPAALNQNINVPENQTENLNKIENDHSIENNTISSDENVEPINEIKENHDSIYNYFDKAEIEKVVQNMEIVEDKKVIIEENKPENVENLDEKIPEIANDEAPIESDNSPGFFSKMFSMFSGSSNTEENEKMNLEKVMKIVEMEELYEESNDDILLSKASQQKQDATCLYDPSQSHCFTEDNPNIAQRTETPNTNDQTNQEIAASTGDLSSILYMEYINIIDLLIVLTVTGVTIVVFLWGYMVIDKNRKEAPLIAKVNNLEKFLLIVKKENQILKDKSEEIQCNIQDNVDSISNTAIEQLKWELDEAIKARSAFEEQVQCLEKELENSTEVGMELNRMLTEVLGSQNGSDTFMANVEQLQSQLVEQQSTINGINNSLNEKDLENHELQLELDINNKKVADLKSELDKLVLTVLKIEEEKEQLQNKCDVDYRELKTKFMKAEHLATTDHETLAEEINTIKTKLNQTQRNLELKTNEYNVLKASIKEVKGSKNSTETLKSLVDVSSLKAELQQLQRDNLLLQDHLKQEQQGKYSFEKQATTAVQEVQVLTEKYDEADKEKVEALTKLEVLGNYFKEKEAQLQKELSKHENMWMEKQGEATSTTERIKFMQGEVQNFKAQNESLKQEIVSQEVELKSQISLLEKKAHENWVHARQAERKFEDARQEAAQLRNRLTFRERSLNEEKSHRILSPLEHTNGDHHPLSPMHMNENSPISPPLLYGARDHLTTSPPMPGLPPFLPPPPGIPFMPPPLPGVPPFMPPPPSMFPGDLRPPPLGRMSSPPLNSRYSPDSRPYSPYDRNSPSPTDDDYYGPPHRGYSPYNGRDDRDRRDYNRPPPPRNNFRNNKGGAMSSGSGNSNESLERINRHHSKV